MSDADEYQLHRCSGQGRYCCRNRNSFGPCALEETVYSIALASSIAMSMIWA